MCHKWLRACSACPTSFIVPLERAIDWWENPILSESHWVHRVCQCCSTLTWMRRNFEHDTRWSISLSPLAKNRGSVYLRLPDPCFYTWPFAATIKETKALRSALLWHNPLYVKYPYKAGSRTIQYRLHTLWEHTSGWTYIELPSWQSSGYQYCVKGLYLAITRSRIEYMIPAIFWKDYLYDTVQSASLWAISWV